MHVSASQLIQIIVLITRKITRKLLVHLLIDKFKPWDRSHWKNYWYGQSS